MNQTAISIRVSAAFLPGVTVAYLLFAATCYAGMEAVCDGTLAAWRQDSSMQQYLADYECTCSNGNSSPPVCRSRNAVAAPTSRKSGKRGPSDEQIVLKEIQNYVDSMFRVNAQAYRKYRQMNLQNSQQIHQMQQALAHSEEKRKQKTAQEEAERREIEALSVHTELLGMPGSVSNDLPDITSALQEDTRKKQLAQCPQIVEKIARYENGIRRIDEVMARNVRMIRDAEDDGKRAADELSDVTAGAAAESLSMGLKSFVQTQKNLQNMKTALDKLKPGTGSGQLSYAQIEQAKKWLDKGLSHGGDVADLTEKSIDYYHKTSLRGTGALGSPYSAKLKSALTDFNEKFMYDAGGWEFVGEHLASIGGGTAGEIAFKAAVVGIKATAAGIGMKLSKNQLRGFSQNQDKMALERYRLEQRIEQLKADFINYRCPVQNNASTSSSVP